jgi:hypothetical protein
VSATKPAIAGSGMPLLTLWEPGLFANNGVAKAAGASLKDCCAIPAMVRTVPASRQAWGAIFLDFIRKLL